jgi:hypothetical protein
MSRRIGYVALGLLFKPRDQHSQKSITIQADPYEEQKAGTEENHPQENEQQYTPDSTRSTILLSGLFFVWMVFHRITWTLITDMIPIGYSPVRAN